MVGPNGAGKTNLLNTIRAIRDVISQRNRALWQEASHKGPSQPAFAFEIDVEWNEIWEQDVLTSFLAAALADERGLSNSIGGVAPEGLRRWSVLVTALISPTWASLFFRGQLVIEYEGMSRWKYSYVSRSAEGRFEIALGDGQAQLIGPGSAPAPVPLFSRLFSNLPSEDQAKLAEYIRAGGDPPRLALPPWAQLLGTQSALLDVSPPTGFMPTHQRFEQASGLSLTSSVQNPRTVLQRLIELQVVLTQNVRRLPRRSFSTEMLKTEYVSLEDGELLALHLFLLQNGKSPDPARYKRVEEIFQLLTGRSFQVRMGASEAGPGEVDLTIWITEDKFPVPFEFSGAGIGEALLLSAAMAADGRTVFLDEPALNLHPAIQGRLVREFAKPGNVQFFVTTHSQVLVAPDSIMRTSRFYKKDGATRRASLDENTLDAKELATLEKELRRSSDARALLFWSAVVLVEGETELGAVPLWYEKVFGQSLDESDITLYSVGGDPGFRTYVQFLQQFEVPWAILCDRPVMFDKSPSRISAQLQAAGVKVPDEPNPSERAAVMESVGVFCPLDSSQKEFEGLDVIRDHRAEALSEVGPSKVRIGRYIADKYGCPEAISSTLHRLRDYIGTKIDNFER